MGWPVKKRADELQKGDLFFAITKVTRPPRRAGPYWVVAVKPGPVRTIVEITVKNLTTGRVAHQGHYRDNRVEIAPTSLGGEPNNVVAK